MKKFEKTTPAEQNSANFSQKKPIFSGGFFQNLVPIILKILPNIDFSKFFASQKQEKTKNNQPTRPQNISENRKFAIKTLETHNKTVEMLKNKKA